MRTISKILVVGAATVALAGAAVAAAQTIHVIDVAMPDGSVQQLRYRGNVQPRIVFVPVRRVTVADPRLADPFLMMDLIAADMRRRSEMLDRQAALLASQAHRGSGRAALAVPGAMPPGSAYYSFVSTNGGNAVCRRMVTVTSAGPGRPAKVVSQSSGNCAAPPSQVRAPTAVAPSAPVARPAKPAKSRVDMRETI
ncbi:MAG TPA: hypothetical protein VJ859_07915 [Allosphingosinicella sp.]|nr:hypothetical protein [Allosphingosinicella sp.]